MFIQRVLQAGVIASLILGMLEVLYGALTGIGFWSPVVFIAATIVRSLKSVGTPVEFQPLVVLLGLMGRYRGRDRYEASWRWSPGSKSAGNLWVWRYWTVPLDLMARARVAPAGASGRKIRFSS